LELNKSKISFSKSFLAIGCSSFVLGIVFAYFVSLPLAFVYLSATVFLFLALFLKNRQRLSIYFILIVLFFVGMVRVYSFNTPQADDISYFVKLGAKRVTLRGQVVSQPEKRFSGKSFLFRVNSIKLQDIFHPASGLVLAQSYNNKNLEFADNAEVEGKIILIEDKGFFAKKLVRQNIRARIIIGKHDETIVTEKNYLNIVRICLLVRDRLREKLDILAQPARGFLKAVLLADKTEIDEEIVAVFRYTGTSHILAISGLHISIIIFMVLIFLKALQIKRWLRVIILIIFLVLYTIITGARPSIIRAVIMASVFLFSFIVGRQYNIYNSLALAALSILFFQPYQIFDVGFQLSFISVLSIIVLTSKFLTYLPRPKNNFGLYLVLSFVASFSAWIGTLPLIAYYFGIIAPVGIFANAVVIFLTTIIMWSGFVFLLFSYLCYPLAQLVAFTIEFMVELLIYITAWFSKWSFAFFYTHIFTLRIVFIYYIVLFLFLNIKRIKSSLRNFYHQRCVSN